MRIAHPPQFGPAVALLCHYGVAKSSPNGWNYRQLGYLYTTTNTNLSARYWCDDECRTILIHGNTAISITHPNTNSPDTNLPTQTLHTNQHKFFSARTRIVRHARPRGQKWIHFLRTARSAHPAKSRRS